MKERKPKERKPKTHPPTPEGGAPPSRYFLGELLKGYLLRVRDVRKIQLLCPRHLPPGTRIRFHNPGSRVCKHLVSALSISY